VKQEPVGRTADQRCGNRKMIQQQAPKNCPWYEARVLSWGASDFSVLGGLRVQLDLTAQIIDPSDQAQEYLFAVTAGEVAGTDVLVLDAVFVVGGGEHGRSDRQDGFLGAAPCA
jgi:hypothetical protein